MKTAVLILAGPGPLIVMAGLDPTIPDPTVMAGLDPAIPATAEAVDCCGDGRVKPDHDDVPMSSRHNENCWHERTIVTFGK